MKISINQKVNRSSSNARLDAFLSSVLASDGFSRSETKRIIESGYFSVNGKPVSKPGFRLAEGDRITGMAIREDEKLRAEHDLDISILFEDEYLLAINKPAGIQVHPSATVKNLTVAGWIKAHRPEILSIGEDEFRPGIVHRLDRDTSGVLVIAKTKESYSALKELFHRHQVAKTYMAVVFGNIHSESGIIAFPIARKKDSIRRVTVRDDRKHPGKVREAVTTYEVTKRFGNFDLLSVYPKTGRTHQIRVHLAAIGHPIVGDALYRKKGLTLGKTDPPVTRQLLHAQAIAFELFGKRYAFEALLPEDFKNFLSALSDTCVNSC